MSKSKDKLPLSKLVGIPVDRLTETEAKVLLKHLIKKIEEFEENNDDFFGTEGWKQAFGLGE